MIDRSSSEEQLGERDALTPRESGRGLVEHEQASGRSPGPCRLPAGAARRARASRQGVLSACKADGRGQLRARSRYSRFLRGPLPPKVARLHAEHGEVAGCPRSRDRNEPCLPVRAGEAERRSLSRRHQRRVLAEQHHAARGRRGIPCDHVEQRRLPAPFGPRIARRSPGTISRSTSRTAWRPPKRRPISRSWRIGSALADSAGAVAASLHLLDHAVDDGLLLPESHGGGRLLADRLRPPRRRRAAERGRRTTG